MNYFRITYLAIVVSFILFTNCKVQENKPFKVTSVSVLEDRFVDNHGREMILNGINVVNKSKEENYLFSGGPEFYSNLKKWGINCIRFIIIWDGLEPEPGVYNESYLQEIDQRIRWAATNNIYVVLDMHQDLYSVKYSDGAPEWATLDEGKPHTTGAIWSDAYTLSAAVQTAFDNFWANKPVMDGKGVQDHYADLWKHIAQRYASNSTIIGYDIMNEPFPGSMAHQATAALLGAYGELVYKTSGKILTEEEVSSTWSNEETRMEAIQLMSTQENFSQVFDVLFDLNQEFETKLLQPFYQKVANAIREVDSKHILFLEHSYYSNIGVRSSIQRTNLTDGTPDALVAYAPHAYDLVTDTKSAALASNVRVDLIFDRIQKTGDQLNMPVWLGEWGAYYNNEGIVPVARHAVSLIEKNKFGHTYWSYYPGLENTAYFKEALQRPFPACINGDLINYSFDWNTTMFTVEWKEDAEIKAPTVLYIPWASKVDPKDYASFGPVSIDTIPDSEAVLISIPASGEKTSRKIQLKLD